MNQMSPHAQQQHDINYGPFSEMLQTAVMCVFG